MPEQTGVAIKRVKETVPVRVLADIPECIREIFDSVERRAYAILESNGRLQGRDLKDWLQAEFELVHRLHLEIAESENSMSIRAEVPGFKASEIEVSVEPRRLTIVGTPESKEQNKTETVLYSERCTDRMLRILELSTEVDTERVTANLENGVLELTLPKAVVDRGRIAGLRRRRQCCHGRWCC